MLTADLILLHAPAFFDFRDREDILFPYLSMSGDTPSTSLYEYFPVGFKTLERYLESRDHSVEIINLSSVLLKHPGLDIDSFLARLSARVIGIDLHWMVHVQGSLAVAERLKRIHPDTPVIFGGISSTYYADELIRRDEVDLVMLGYDTHAAMDRLLLELKGDRQLGRVPNLCWKDSTGAVQKNPFEHKPATLACGIDWTRQPSQPENMFPILELLSTQNAGCAYNCNWCGGSRDAFRRIMGVRKALIRKPVEEVEYEFRTIQNIPDRSQYHFYSLGAYNETAERLDALFDAVAGSGLRSISYEQFHLTPEPVLRRMAAANARTSITLSPESHDMRLARLAGRGVYTMEEMEAWIERALDLGIFQIDVWFFVGLQEQTPESIIETTKYCDRLLARFAGRNVGTLICPMIPFLDPASTFFETPDEYGYRTHFRTLEEHRRGMENTSLINRINYSTKWLSRRDLVVTGYGAVRRLFEARARHGALPSGLAASVCQKIDDSLEFLLMVDEIDNLPDPEARRRELAKLGGEIRRRNSLLFGDKVVNQAFPIQRQIGGRWFDEIPAFVDEMVPKTAGAAAR